MAEVKPIWAPLDSRPFFLVKRGELRSGDVQALVDHFPGSRAAFVFGNPNDVVRALPGAGEPLDRLAGLISEE